MAEDQIRRTRDCVNPTIMVEHDDSKLIAVHVAPEHTIIEGQPSAVFIGDVRYVPASSVPYSPYVEGK